MVTKNFKNMLAMCAESSGTVKGCLPATDVNGRPVYLNGAFSNSTFPASRSTSVTLTAGAAGISVGTGATAAKDSDYNLENHISSGISLVLTASNTGCDNYGSPYVEYSLTITNTGSDQIEISEIGYKQSFPCVYKPTFTSNVALVFLLDRTVFETPLTLAAGDAGVIQYRISTYPQPHQTKGDIDLVSFTHGTDQQIAAMIDAAQQGTIDLQEDAGWCVGDMRTISVGAWVAGNNVSQVAQDLNIVITSFENYNNCGCVLQFDFLDVFDLAVRFNATASTSGGYGASEMYTTTLPALVEALPSWLKSRLLAFGVLTGKGGGSTDIETVANNKLALRSEVEVTGASTLSAQGEGTQIEFYKKWKYKGKGVSSTTTYQNYGFRSPYNETNYVYIAYNAGIYSVNANNLQYLAPFGCL